MSAVLWASRSDLSAHHACRFRDRELLPEYVATTENWADGQTKALPAPAFARFASEVCVTAHPHPHTRVP